jgi:hypothetical protein
LKKNKEENDEMDIDSEESESEDEEIPRQLGEIAEINYDHEVNKEGIDTLVHSPTIEHILKITDRDAIYEAKKRGQGHLENFEWNLKYYGRKQEQKMEQPIEPYISQTYLIILAMRKQWKMKESNGTIVKAFERLSSDNITINCWDMEE